LACDSALIQSRLLSQAKSLSWNSRIAVVEAKEEAQGRGLGRELSLEGRREWKRRRESESWEEAISII